MTHIRQQIRESLATVISGLTTTGENVYQSRVYPYDILPCLSVYTKEETAEYDSLSFPRSSRRELLLTIEIRAKESTDVDDKIDQISAEVEAAVSADITLGGISKDIQYQGIDIQLEGGTNQPTALGIMNYNIIYRVLETDAEQPA